VRSSIFTGLPMTWSPMHSRIERLRKVSQVINRGCALVVVLIVIALSQALAGDDAVDGVADAEINMTGDLTIGDATYTVKSNIILDRGACRSLAMSIHDGGLRVTEIEVTSTDSEGAIGKYGGRRYRLDASIPSAWAQLASLTAKDVVSRFKGVKTSLHGGGWSWEVADMQTLRPGLPVKMRFVFPDSEGDDDSENLAFSEIVVWSLAEWNNSFNENLLLHLRLDRKVKHDQ